MAASEIINLFISEEESPSSTGYGAL